MNSRDIRNFGLATIAAIQPSRKSTSLAEVKLLLICKKLLFLTSLDLEDKRPLFFKIALKIISHRLQVIKV